jgi:hypothetical protein
MSNGDSDPSPAKRAKHNPIAFSSDLQEIYDDLRHAMNHIAAIQQLPYSTPSQAQGMPSFSKIIIPINRKIACRTITTIYWVGC